MKFIMFPLLLLYFYAISKSGIIDKAQFPYLRSKVACIFPDLEYCKYEKKQMRLFFGGSITFYGYTLEYEF